jgi:hypothetical protein
VQHVWASYVKGPAVHQLAKVFYHGMGLPFRSNGKPHELSPAEIQDRLDKLDTLVQDEGFIDVLAEEVVTSEGDKDEIKFELDKMRLQCYLFNRKGLAVLVDKWHEAFPLGESAVNMSMILEFTCKLKKTADLEEAKKKKDEEATAEKEARRRERTVRQEKADAEEATEAAKVLKQQQQQKLEESEKTKLEAEKKKEQALERKAKVDQDDDSDGQKAEAAEAEAEDAEAEALIAANNVSKAQLVFEEADKEFNITAVALARSNKELQKEEEAKKEKEEQAKAELKKHNHSVMEGIKDQMTENIPFEILQVKDSWLKKPVELPIRRMPQPPNLMFFDAPKPLSKGTSHNTVIILHTLTTTHHRGGRKDSKCVNYAVGLRPLMHCCCIRKCSHATDAERSLRGPRFRPWTPICAWYRGFYDE